MQNGPFKRKIQYGEPCVDIFSQSVFAKQVEDPVTHQSVTLTRTHSPRIGILGAETYSPDAHRDVTIVNDEGNSLS